ncbi:hypothetical protein PGUG_00038 [Meyerozyma guilliermondii ATCC 6260]|uniref:G domain-containing protein n=1 Tax=Meyerozyma guilliermondii (strain ATCC 6260 / CBS 566 / DSM 6381 / JCM 1539 / NBRC 10279 / NRRL Y-324) TaxID=294746 RepID=A5D9T3_PICGU|nr:uncharacterized protein PGUG_00038 [Meyerozyma guilliermondii ATCC 6260]EDK35940.2 hypothetical protein PGUG_00038 [Meyerozyma guilliermondii ATCC 6260]
MSFVPRRVFPTYRIPLSNFKGHHQKALNKFGSLAPQIDFILEVRDSRAPISTINVLFNKVLAHKPRLIIYSKKDLSVLKRPWTDKLHKSRNEQYLFVDARNKQDSKKILNFIKDRYFEMSPPPPLGLRMMLIGMPNVGKSTLVNTLRSVGLDNSGAVSSKVRKVARTGGQPGVTRATSEIIKLSNDPDILVHDTPGVFLPTVKDAETMLALSLVGCVHTSFVDPVIQADYLLYILNLQDPSGSKYSEYIDHPTNSVDELLYKIAETRNVVRKDGTFDMEGMAIHWVSKWKQGKSDQYKGLFDLAPVLEQNEEEIRSNLNLETNRVASMQVTKKLTDRLGEDGTATSKARKRNAKDRAADHQNQLFKL